MIHVVQKECPPECLVSEQNLLHTRWLKNLLGVLLLKLETLVVLNDGVQPSDDVDEAAKEIFNDNDVNGFLNLDEGIDGWT